MSDNWIICIPARIESSRFPGKLLKADTGKPLLAHTIEAAIEATGDHNRVFVITDHTQLERVALDCDVNCIRRADDCINGTERIRNTLALLPNVDRIINWQADEPEVRPKDVRLLADCDEDSAAADVVTLISPLYPPDCDNPNLVKVAIDHQGGCLYFSRAPIPWKNQQHYNLHHGVYCSPRFEDFPRTVAPAELSESLEQIRWLYFGYSIDALPIAETPPGINTPEDYKAFVERIKSRR